MIFIQDVPGNGCSERPSPFLPILGLRHLQDTEPERIQRGSAWVPDGFVSVVGKAQAFALKSDLSVYPTAYDARSPRPELHRRPSATGRRTGQRAAQTHPKPSCSHEFCQKG